MQKNESPVFFFSDFSTRRGELWWIAMHNDSLIMSRDAMAIHSSNMAMLLPSEIDGQSNKRVTDINHFGRK